MIRNIAFLLTLFLTLTAANAEIKVENPFKERDISNFRQVKSHNNLLFTLLPFNSGKKAHPYSLTEHSYFLYQYNVETDEWKQLLDGKDIVANDIDMDNTGNLWVAAEDGLYKYNSGNWDKYYVDDSLKNFRSYKRLCIDSSGNVWVQAYSAFIDQSESNKNKTIIDRSYIELLKFNKVNFESIEFFQELNSFGISTDNAFFASGNGKIYMHLNTFYPFRKVPRDTNDLYIYSEDGEKTKITLQNPNSDNNTTEKKVASAYPDSKGNIWFGFGRLSTSYGTSYMDPGITVLESNGNWDIITTKNNGLYKFRYNYDIRDSVYVQCNGLYEDKDGKMWIGGQYFFGYFDNDRKLRIPNDSFFKKCELYSDINYSNSHVKNYLDQITSYYERSKLPLEEQIIGLKVEHITGTSDGSIWIAMPGLGLLRYNPNITNVEDNNITTEEFKIYPNPVSKGDGKINLILHGNNQGTVDVKLYSLTGKEILHKDANFFGDLGQLKIPSNISEGFYLIEVKTKTNTFRKKILIKN